VHVQVALARHASYKGLGIYTTDWLIHNGRAARPFGLCEKTRCQARSSCTSVMTNGDRVQTCFWPATDLRPLFSRWAS
jgi:hypothetical protein